MKKLGVALLALLLAGLCACGQAAPPVETTMAKDEIVQSNKNMLENNLPIDALKAQEAAEHCKDAGIGKIAAIDYSAKKFGYMDVSVRAAVKTPDGKIYSITFLVDGSVGAIKNEQNEYLYYYVPIE